MIEAEGRDACRGIRHPFAAAHHNHPQTDAAAGEYGQYAISIGGVVAAVDSSIADVISQLAGWW